MEKTAEFLKRGKAKISGTLAKSSCPRFCIPFALSLTSKSEDRLHLSKIKLYLILRSVCTIFAAWERIN